LELVEVVGDSFELFGAGFIEAAEIVSMVGQLVGQRV
jgi:hypothetical protein